MKGKIFVQSIVALLILVLVASSNGACQPGASDSLIALLKIKSGSERIDILFEIAWTYADVDDEKALLYTEQGFKLACQKGDTVRIVKLGRAKAQFFRRLNKFDSASNLLNKLIPIAIRHNLSAELASMLNSLGLIHQSIGRYDEALRLLFDALSLREKEGNVFYICSVLNNIGLVYYALDDLEKSLSFYKRAVQMKKDVSDKSDLDLYYSNIGLCYALMKDFGQAKLYIDEATSICRDSCKTEVMILIFHCKGIISFYEGNLLKSEASLLKAYKLCDEIDDRKHKLNAIDYLLRIYTEENRLMESEKYLNEVDEVITAGAPYHAELSNIYYNAIKLFKKANQLEKMSLYQDKYIAIIDAIFNEDLTTSLMKIEAQYLEKENLAKIDSQNKILTLNGEIMRAHKLLNIFVGVIALLLIILIIILIKSNRQKHKHNMLLDKKVQERTHQLQLSHDTLHRAGQERDILLEKISTDINRALATLKGLCFVGMKDVTDPEAREYISKINLTSDSFSNILAKLQFIRSGAASIK